MKKYNGLGKEGLDYEDAMELLDKQIEERDPYVMNLLFDLVMEEADDNFTDTTLHNRS